MGGESMVAYGSRETEDGIETIFCEGCPFDKVPPVARWLMDFYQPYMRGSYLNEGGLLDQPAFYLEGMAIIEVEMSKIRSQRMAEEKKELEDMARRKRR